MCFCEIKTRVDEMVILDETSFERRESYAFL